VTNAYVDLYLNSSTGTLVYRFNPAPLKIDLNYDKSGVSNIDIPSQVRPMGFDMTSQNRQIRIDFILLNSGVTYSSDTPGATGTYLDMMEDLDKAFQGLNSFVGTNNLFVLVIPFPSALFTGGHQQSSANTSTCVSGSGDKLFYVNFRSLSFSQEGGAPGFMKGTVVFEEVDLSSGVIMI